MHTDNELKEAGIQERKKIWKLPWPEAWRDYVSSVSSQLSSSTGTKNEIQNFISVLPDGINF